jgi:hypothetical protein
MQNPPKSSLIDRSSAFPLPFSREQLHQDILNIVLLEMRKLRHLTSGEAKFSELDLPIFSSAVFWDAGMTPEDFGLQYDHIKNLELALALEDQFNYGFYAVDVTRSESLQWDTIHTWIGAYLVDLARSAYASEWGKGEGHEGLIEGIQRCLFTCELANARVILEGSEPFYHFADAGQAKDEGSASEGELSIRQLSMLCGIEEMSLRSAISRKTQPILEICKDDRRTYIEATTALKWLNTKGRYLKVITRSTSGDIDLSTTRFDTSLQLCVMLHERLTCVIERGTSSPEVETEIAAVLACCKAASLNDLTDEELSNGDLMWKIAGLLDLPADLLVFRARESVLRTEIAQRDLELKQLQQRLSV